MRLIISRSQQVVGASPRFIFNFSYCIFGTLELISIKKKVLFLSTVTDPERREKSRDKQVRLKKG